MTLYTTRKTCSGPTHTVKQLTAEDILQCSLRSERVLGYFSTFLIHTYGCYRESITDAIQGRTQRAQLTLTKNREMGANSRSVMTSFRSGTLELRGVALREIPAGEEILVSCRLYLYPMAGAVIHTGKC